MQVSITENQLETMRVMSEIAEQVVMDYPEVSDSRYVARHVKDFLFLWEEKGFEANSITIEKIEAFSGQKTPVSEPPREAPAMQARPALQSIENLQNFESSCTRQLFDL